MLNIPEDIDDLPPRLRKLLPLLPEYIDAKQAAQVVSAHCFVVSNRTVEIWPLPTRYINGRTQHPTVEVLREAWRRICNAPEGMRGPPPRAVGIGRGRRRTPTGEFERVSPIDAAE